MQTGIYHIPSNGDVTVTFPKKFRTKPIVILSAHGNSGNSEALLVEDPQEDSFKARMITYSCSWETGYMHWIAIESDFVDPTNRIKLGVKNVGGNGDWTITFDKAMAKPPVVLLTGLGNNDHSTSCLVGDPTTQSFKARLIHCSGAWETGKSHWIAIEKDSFDIFGK